MQDVCQVRLTEDANFSLTLFPVPYSPFPIPYSLFPVPYPNRYDNYSQGCDITIFIQSACVYQQNRVRMKWHDKCLFSAEILC